MFSSISISPIISQTLTSCDRGANPAYTAEELVYQIRTAKATALFIHPDSLKVGLEAARIAGIPLDRVALYDTASGGQHLTVDDLVREGLAQTKRWIEPKLKPGEGKTKLALLFFSSGTTGRPKVCGNTTMSEKQQTLMLDTGSDDPALCDYRERRADEAVCRYTRPGHAHREATICARRPRARRCASINDSS